MTGLLVYLMCLIRHVERSALEPLTQESLVPNIWVLLTCCISEIDEDHMIIHDSVVIQHNVLVNEAVAVQFFECFYHLNKDIGKGQLVGDANSVKVLLN